jgi:hypothetical protein
MRRWQAVDPNFATGKRIREIVADVIEENNCIEKIKSNLVKLNYYSIRDECERLSAVACSSQRRDNARLLADLFDAYINVDMLNYDSALSIFKKIMSNKINYPSPVAETIDTQKSFLSEIASGRGSNPVDETAWNLTDLFFNMKRSFVRGDYNDVLARFRRIIEGGAYFILRTVFGINPRDVDESPSEDNLEFLKGIHGFQNITGFIECQKACEAVRRLRDQINCSLNCKTIFKKEEEEKRRVIMNRRNNSIIAHGMSPISKEDVVNCMPCAELFLTELVPISKQKINDYPFTEEKIKSLVDILLS